MNLSEKFRPRTWADFVGQAEAVRRARFVMSRPDFGRESGDAWWIGGGPSGCGKTSLALLVARDLGCNEFTAPQYQGKHVNAQTVRDIEQDLWYCPQTGTWKCIIIDEGHLIRDGAVEAFLTLLEHLPARRLVIFTSTSDLLDKAPADPSKVKRSWVDWGEHNGPWARRCKRFPFTAQGVCEAGAARIKGIAEAEGLDGQPVERYARLLADCHNNIGLALQEVEMGAMVGEGASA